MRKYFYEKDYPTVEIDGFLSEEVSDQCVYIQGSVPLSIYEML
jgi:hypothetical protein